MKRLFCFLMFLVVVASGCYSFRRPPRIHETLSDAEFIQLIRDGKRAELLNALKEFYATKQDLPLNLAHGLSLKEFIFFDNTIKEFWIEIGQVFLGMTEEQAKKAWGLPFDINTTIGSYGTHEQWVYGNRRYLYFEDGILTTIQH